MISAKVPPTDLNALASEKVGAPYTMAGWINPAGDYFRVAGDWGHSALADRIVDQPGENYEKLYADGWVHLGELGTFCVDSRHGLTPAQKNTLLDVALLVEGSDFAEKIISRLRDEGD
jgi:hypothetical protein